ncbi:SMP-30/gluconolactonase/LRE family protein [Phototrophicus methaneseepsis]|uniref:SMP-30/gluconolactonase/LRE family protein n=1 Tax=Phototrophicus methaneseepsis TaxID=2710758 RepID=A0A7S8EAW4_9CHLR|nr:SMP-30/gluconolactonase/LRE family protein [Phototrophicus methaneseepsis]QPC83561.1 SMP-30/gluconolactonase/LRE family protein [Phototrophicus methaneseepsis]
MSQSPQPTARPSMTDRIQNLPATLRIIIFVGGSLMALLACVVVTVLVIVLIAYNQPRTEAVAMQEDVTIQEFAQLPDDDAYPSSLALAEDGTLYTASYQSGTVWAISPEGEVTELASTRDQIGAVIAIEIAPDGTLYALDHSDPIAVQGGVLWHISGPGYLSEAVTLPVADGATPLFFDDLAIDSDGTVYISERVEDRIWRWQPGTDAAESWWQAPTRDDAAQQSPGGLAYDPVNNAIVVADAALNTLSRIPIDADDPQAATEQIYRYIGEPENTPAFDGLTITADGTIYVTALGLNSVARLDGDTLTYLAQGFRGSSDVAFDAGRNLLYVNNWDQSHLQPQTVFLFFRMYVPPSLPFGIDVLSLPG